MSGSDSPPGEKLLRVPLSPLRSGDMLLPEAAARYVSRVHRLGVGDHFVAFDPEEATEADAEVTSAGRSVTCTVGEVRASTAVAAPGLTLFQAMGKIDKPEQVVRAATALGVEELVFVESRRTIVRVGDRAESRLGRWHAIAVEAARQSGRGDVPRISGPLRLEEVPARGNEENARRIYLAADAPLGMAAALSGYHRGDKLAVLIGPEGGFDAREITMAEEAGFVGVALGRFVMRTETATVAALGAIAALGDRATV